MSYAKRPECIKKFIFISQISEEDHGFAGELLKNDGYTNAMIQSIRDRGVDKPICVYCYEDHYRICDGWHRWKICQLLEIPMILCEIYHSLEECEPSEENGW